MRCPESQDRGALMVSPMSKPERNMPFFPTAGPLCPPKRRKIVPHEFVLDAIASLSPITHPMFGCLAVYVDDKIVFILRDKHDKSANNGVWLAIGREHRASLRREFPHMRSIWILGKKMTGWQVLPLDAPDFEKAALRACELVIARDPRICRVGGARRSRVAAAKKPARSFSRSAPCGSGTIPGLICLGKH
jgi:hypothetical protein